MRLRLNYLTAVAGGFVGAVLTFLAILGAGQLYLLTNASRLDRTPLPGEGVRATYLFGIPPYVLFVLLPIGVGVALGAALSLVVWVRSRRVS